MEFKKVPNSPRTPEGYRLATLDEADRYFQKLKTQKILESLETVRVLEGWIRTGSERCEYSDSLPKHMLVLGRWHAKSRGRPFFRKELYSDVSPRKERKNEAIRLSWKVGDVEAVCTLLQHENHSEDTLKEYSTENSQGFLIIVKMLLIESCKIDEHEVTIALDYALQLKANGGGATAEANYAISVAEVVCERCCKDIVDSQIKRVGKLIENTEKASTVKVGVFTKLLSESEKLVDDIDLVDIIKSRFGRLFEEAVRRGYVALVERLLRLQEEVEKTIKDSSIELGKYRKTLLHYAAEWEGNEKSNSVSKSLYKKYEECNGKDFVKRKDINGTSVLHNASLRGRVEFCEFLVDNYELKVEERDDKGQTALHHAAMGKGGESILQFFTSANKDIILSKDKKAKSALHKAAYEGNLEMVGSLLELKLNVNDTDISGRSPLHLAAQQGHVEIVKKLLEFSSETDLLEHRDITGKTPLHYAVAKINHNAKEIIEKLVESCIRLERKALFLWVSAAGIGTADETEDLDTETRTFIRGKMSKFKSVNLTKAAAEVGNVRLTWELLNRGADITQLHREEPQDSNSQVCSVMREIEKFCEQGRDQPTVVDTLGRDVLAECVAAHFLNPYIKSPITVGISGGSGMGKTSVMNQIECVLLTTAAQLAFPDLGHYEKFTGAKEIRLNSKGKKMYHEIEKGICYLMEKTQKKTKHMRKMSLVNFLAKYRPEYHTVYKSLACMDFNQMVEKKERDSVYESEGQSIGAVPRVLTVSFNAGNYRGRHEAWAGLAVEITKEIEESMTRAQWLSTCWRNSRRTDNINIYLRFILPGLLLTVLAGWIAWMAWLLLTRSNLSKEMKDLKYGSIPATIITIVWGVLRSAVSVLKPVSTKMTAYFNLPDNSQQLGYQQKVISDIMFLQQEIGKKPCFIFYFIAGEMCWNWFGLLKDNIENTSIPKYGSAPADKLRIIAFVDDLDHCENDAILKVLWAINLIFRVCKINVILTMDKNAIETGLKKSLPNEDEDYTDKFMSKLIQLPVNLPDPADDEWQNFLDAELGREPNLNKSAPKDEAGDTDTDEEESDGKHIMESANAAEDIESGGSQEDAPLTQQKQGLCSRFIEVLRGIQSFLKNVFPFPCHIKNQDGREEEERTINGLTSQELSKRVRLIRETLTLSYSKEEIDIFHRLRRLATGHQKLPREWKRYLNYHKFARNVVSKKAKKGNKQPSGWQVEFVAWTFVCSQCKHEMNILIQNWEKHVHIKDNKGQQIDSPSLKQIVENYIESQNVKNKGAKEEERWRNLQKVLGIQDVSMEGIECFQQFRFHCEARNLTFSLESQPSSSS